MDLEEGGIMKFSYERNRLNIKTKDVIIKYRGLPVPGFILNFILSNVDIPTYIFEESGEYTILFRSEYSKDGETHLMTFRSDKFEVLDK